MTTVHASAGVHASKGRRRWSFLALTALLAAVVGCGGPGGDDGSTAQMRRGPGGGSGPPGGEERPIPVAAEVAEPRELQLTLRASANLRAREEVEVLPKQQGVVQELLAEEGDRVSAGDVLARMDDEQWQLEARRAEARARSAEEQAERARALQEQGLFSDQEVENLQSEAAVAEADLELARLRVRNAEIAAPIDGVVTHRHIERGELLSTAEAAFEIADDRTLQARVGIPERQVDRVREGQTVWIRAEEGEAEPVTGRVVRLRPVVDAESGTVQVTVEVDPGSSRDLRPGRFVNVDIVTDVLPDRLAVPRTAVVAEGAVPTVFVLRGDRAEEVEVELGYSQGDRVEIRSGLEPGDTVVVVGQSNLRDDAPVRLMELDGRVLEGQGMSDDEDRAPEEGALPGEELPGEEPSGEVDGAEPDAAAPAEGRRPASGGDSEREG